MKYGVIHVLIRRYVDGSGFYVVGATTSDAVAQAFQVGTMDTGAEGQVYTVEIDAPLRHALNAYTPEPM